MLIVIELVCVILGCLPHSFRLPLNLTCSGTRQASVWLETQILSTTAACFFAAEPLEVLYWVFFCSGSLVVQFPSPNRLPSNLLAPPKEGYCIRTVSVVSGKATKGSEKIRENAAVTCTVVWDQILCYWLLSSFIQYGWKTYFVFPVLKKLLNPFYGVTYDIPWRMFHMHWRKMCTLLLLCGLLSVKSGWFLMLIKSISFFG